MHGLTQHFDLVMQEPSVLEKGSADCTASQGLLPAVCEVIAEIPLLNKNSWGPLKSRHPGVSSCLPGVGGGGSQVSDGGGAKGGKGSFRLWEKACTQSGLQLVYCNRKSTQNNRKRISPKATGNLVS